MNRLTICTAALLLAASLVSCGRSNRDPEEYVVAENFTVYESTAAQQTATAALTETITAPTEETRLSYALNGTNVELSINDRKVKTLEYYYTPDEKHIIVDDFNFDGFKDIYIPYENAESGCGDYYCYDSVKKDFYEDKALAEIGMEMTVTGDNQLTQTYDNGYITRAVDYQWQDGRLVAVQKTESYTTGDNVLHKDFYKYDKDGSAYLVESKEENAPETTAAAETLPQ
jgi:hypothetical protein